MWALFKCCKTNNIRAMNLSQVTYIESHGLHLSFTFTNRTLTYNYNTIEEAKEAYNSIAENLNTDKKIVYSVCEKE